MAKVTKADPPEWSGGPGGPGSVQPGPDKVLIHIPPSQQSCQYPVPKAGDPVDPNNELMQAKRAKQAEAAAEAAKPPPPNPQPEAHHARTAHRTTRRTSE